MRSEGTVAGHRVTQNGVRRLLDRARGVGSGPWLRAAFAVLLGCLVLGMSGMGSYRTEVVLELRTDAGADGEVFYAGPDQDHAADRRIPFVLVPDGQWHTYRITLREGELRRVRLDPGSLDGAVEIRRLAVDWSGRSVDLTGTRLADAQAGVNLLQPVRSDAAGLAFLASAPDPFVDFHLPAGTGVVATWQRVAPWAAAILAFGVFWLSVGEFVLRACVRAAGRAKLPGCCHRLAARLSDRGVLQVPPRAVAVLGATTLCAVLYIALHLHQSSIGVWDHFFGDTSSSQIIEVGTPRAIRSDEWNALTPWVLSQVARGNEVSNPSIGGEAAPLLASVPVEHISSVAQAKFYGFFLFDASTGFSWWWAYKSFGLFLSFFWLLIVLTRGDTLAATIGAAWVYASSFTQWWFSSNLPEVLTAFALSTVGALYLLFSSRRLGMAAGTILVVYGALNLLLHIYPPFILPLAFLGATILAGIALESGKGAVLRSQMKWRAVCAVGGAVVFVLIAGRFMIDALPTIEVMRNTVYPGNRVSGSGDVTVSRLMYGFFEALRVGDGRLPLPPTNGSEASSFIMLFPLLFGLPLVVFFRRANALLAALLGYLLMVAAWICIQLPAPIEKFMQLLGWSWSPPIRAVLGLGIGSIVAVVVMFSRVRRGDIEQRTPIMRGYVPAIVFFSVAALGWSLQQSDSAYFGDGIVLGAAIAATLVAAGVMFGRGGVLAGGLALFLLPAMTVNPLSRGLSALDDKPVLAAAREQTDSSKDRWAVVGAFVLSQGLKSQGLDVITGSHMVPNLEMAHVFDPTAQSEEVWNRYAHVVLRSEPAARTAVYKLLAPDLYEVGIDVCGPELRKLGVTRVAYTEPVPVADNACLHPLKSPESSGVRLFRLNSTPPVDGRDVFP